MTNVTRLYLLTALLCLCGNALALQLGSIRSGSSLGEPLEASVSIWHTPTDDLAAMRLRIKPDLSYHSNTAITQIVDTLRAELAYTPTGRAYIRVTSTGSINEPVIAFRLEAGIGDTGLIRNYALALRPQPTATVPSARRRIIEKAEPARVTPIAGGAHYGPVKPGETLWRIARQVSATQGGNTANLVTEIFAANPHAFIGNDQNKLKVGVTLNVPGQAALTPVEAAPVAINLEATTPAAAAAPTFVAAPTPAATVTRAKTDWRARDPELAARLAELERKYAAIRARYDAAKAGAAATPVATTAVGEPVASPPRSEDELQITPDSLIVAAKPTVQDVEQPFENEPTVAASESPAADVGTEKEIAIEATPVVAEVQPQAVFLEGIPYKVALGLLIAGCLVIATLAGLRRVIFVLQHRRGEAQHTALEKDRKAEVARKAEQRVEIESQVREMLASREQGQAGDGSTISRSSDRLAKDDAAKPQAPLTREAEIDLNIAHGRYFDAEKLLTEVIAEAPRNHAAKLRLAEVYYITERIEEFVTVAADIYQNHRVDIGDDDWQRVMRMGKIIAPNRPPFSGPQSITAGTVSDTS
jgi:pilus assembly protein FimV